MRINPLAREPAPQPHTAAAHQPGSRACFVTPAPLLDILLEQLEYLAAHVGPACHAGCVDCARLSHVKNWLLLPFRAGAPTGRPRPTVPKEVSAKIDNT